MKITGNTILITGGGSGIGRRLAELLQAAGNQVIIAGRDTPPLGDVTSASPGMKSVLLDVDDPTAIRAVAADITKTYPSLNVLMNVAGIMRPEKLVAAPENLADSEAIITTYMLRFLSSGAWNDLEFYRRREVGLTASRDCGKARTRRYRSIC